MVRDFAVLLWERRRPR